MEFLRLIHPDHPIRIEMPFVFPQKSQVGVYVMPEPCEKITIRNFDKVIFEIDILTGEFEYMPDRSGG